MSRSPDVLDALVEAPPSLRRRTPLVLVHGRRTEPADILASFAAQARDSGLALVAPHFVAPAFAGYQFLAGQAGPMAAATALNDLLDRLGAEQGLETAKVDLLGFSAGAQFAHRYAMAHPERVRRLILVAPGWYAFPDPEVEYPAGLKGFPWPRGGPSLEAFLDVPTLVIVGSRDTARGGGLRSTSEIDAQQGMTRLARAERWSRRLREEAERRGVESRVETLVLTDLGHSWKRIMADGGLAEIALEFLARPAGFQNL